MSASKHGWHLFCEERGLEVRQATNRVRKNRWEVRKPNGLVLELSDEEFEELRCGRPVKGL